MRASKRIAVVCFSVLVLLPMGARADVKLPAIFSDHAVLQRDMKLPIWGKADPGEEVTVSIAGQTQKTKADANGKWRVTLEPLSVGEPLTMTVAGKNKVEVKDILVGEVWLCSGQSNMEWDVVRAKNGDLEIASANNPKIRFVSVKEPGSQTPVEDFKGKWDVCSPKTVSDFSAVGYFFGRELLEQLDVPIGLIDDSWGGSACDAWIPREKMEGNPLYKAQLEQWDARAAEYEAAKAKPDFDPKDPEMKKLADALAGQGRPANLYHSRLKPVMGYGIRGSIWYQGESNAGRAYQYREMFPLMIKTWREDWGQGDFPFYFVQLADFMPEKAEPGESAWAELREAQTMTLDRLPNVGQAVIIDIGEGADIHPANKLEVAKRLARWALVRDYGKQFAYASPRYDSMTKEGDKIVVKFKDVTGGLKPIDAKDVLGFTIAGEDKKFVKAEATIVDKDHVAVRSDQVKNPVAVRYAWADNPVCNLYDSSLLPVTPFRTDEWPGVTADAR